MNRLIRGLAILSFLALVSLQSAHKHERSAPESCQICVLGAQAVRHMPASSPSIVPLPVWIRVNEKPAPRPRLFYRLESSARAPPLA